MVLFAFRQIPTADLGPVDHFISLKNRWLSIGSLDSWDNLPAGKNQDILYASSLGDCSMSNDLDRLLGRNPLFSSLGPQDRQALIRDAVCRKYTNGQWVAHNGDVWPYLFIIETGSITAKKESAGGRSLLAARFEAGEVFWGLAFFLEDAPMPAGLAASADCQIHLWSRESLLPVLMANGTMAWQLTMLMVNRMLLASKIVEGLAFQPVAGRLASWLMERYSGAGGELVSRDMTLDEMAAHIGTTREMVCRALYRFAEDGAVQINRTEFKISDSEILERYIVKG